MPLKMPSSSEEQEHRMCRGWERPSGSSPSPLVVSAEADQILFAGVPHQHPQHPQHQH